MALVCEPINSAMRSGSMHIVSSTSQKTGTAPVANIACTFDRWQSDGTMTSSPGPQPATIIATCNAAPPVLTATGYRSVAPMAVATADSNVDTSTPRPSQPRRSAASTAAMSSSSSIAPYTGIEFVGPRSKSLHCLPCDPTARLPVGRTLRYSLQVEFFLADS